MRTTVMQGALGEGKLNLPTVLRAVSLSRQLTCIRIQDGNQHLSGEIQVKAGRLVSATHEDKIGKDAFFEILSQDNSFFRVEKLENEVDIPPSLGMVGTLLDEAPKERSTSTATRQAPHLRVAQSPNLQESAAGQENLAALATPIEGLHALAVLDQTHGVLQWRRDADQSNQGLAKVISDLVGLSKSLKTVMSVDRQPEIIISGIDNTIVLTRISDTVVAAAAFEGKVAAGFARFQLARLVDPIKGQL